MKPEAHRIQCEQGHTLAVTRSGDEDVEASVINHYGFCPYCRSSLKAIPTTVEDFYRWSTRDDGRYAGSDAQ